MDKYALLQAVTLSVITLLLISVAGCIACDKDNAGDESASEPYTTVSAEDIKKGLEGLGPITAGFDIDGTAFFTESVYYYGLNNIDGPNGTNLYGSDPLADPEFISRVNNEFVGQYIPKEGAEEIISMHLGRGDKVIFITKKAPSAEERITEYIGSVFGIKDPVLIFTNESSKMPYINEEDVSVYYGDSDGDITECNDAESCTPYRFMRNIITEEYYGESYNPGIYGENVVENSDC
ncbi:HAD family acid phosphatase [Methanoplanus endosymbiosus]|uniref:Lipoprotein n=1 Tax=Methanoplanus endosymbiosus TaxID=33865 RepID=A0A9E7PLU0_9EURY|nr:HAD family acid phosphatase [Methanoplanus endosymbiosus]UUX92543.1 hypothetical protein L6E24_14610 [Methanoplanus endosymbiosus]